MPSPCWRRAPASTEQAAAAVAALWLLASAAAASGVALSGKPPRLNACREIMKAKSDGEVYAVSSSYSCQNITFPCTALAYPDTRNCENYYKCDSLTITQCPCPPGQTFNIATLSCDTSGSACDCAGPATSSTVPPAPSTSVTTAASTTNVVTTGVAAAASTAVKPSASTSAVGTTSVASAFAGDAGVDIERSPSPVVEAQLPAAADASGNSGTTAAGPGARSISRVATQQSSATDAAAAGVTANSAASDSSISETSIIIAAIVCASAVTVAIVGVVVYLCHAARFRAKKDAKLPGLPCGESSGSGYTQPGTDRHLYYEIDDRAVLGSSKSFIYRPRPPPLPTTQPPAHPPCVRCLDASGAAAGTVFVAPPPPPSGKRSFPVTNPHYRAAAAAVGGSGGSAGELHYGSSSAFGGGGGGSLPPHSCCGCPSEFGGGVVVIGGGHCHSRESSSDCSLYSGVGGGGGGSSCSNQSTLESCVDGGDMRAPLNARHSGGGGGSSSSSSRTTYVSKQVYI